MLSVVKRHLYRPRFVDSGRQHASGLRYQIKKLIEQANYSGTEVVHDLPAIHDYWASKHLAPLFEPFGFKTVDQFFQVEAKKVLATSQGHRVLLLSIGSGNCDFEVALARNMRRCGHGNFAIQCMDINRAMLKRGLKLATDNGVEDHILPVEADFNEWTPGNAKYDAVLANQSLHHVINLEGLFDGIETALTIDGRFIVSDMIGRNGHMRWPEALDIVNSLWRGLPPQYRFNHHLGRAYEVYENYDGSQAGFEGIRAQDILPLLIERFHFHVFVPFANVIDVFVDRAIGPNFDPNREWDRQFIDRVHRLDMENLEAGRITPTHMVASMSVSTVTSSRNPGRLSPEFCVRKQTKRDFTPQ